jgi:peptide-methionine (S)-S-oxide reductase
MVEKSRHRVVALFSLALMAAVQACSAASGSVSLPAPATDVPASSVKGPQTAVFAGGCFWGVEAVFRHVKGVSTAVSGYAGGSAKTADYTLVSTGMTGHAESVQVTYDPAQVSYGELLRIFFSVAHDPTQLDRQGPITARNTGPRSSSPENRNASRRPTSIGSARPRSRGPIVTEVTALPGVLSGRGVPPELPRTHTALHRLQRHAETSTLKQQFPDRYVAAEVATQAARRRQVAARTRRRSSSSFPGTLGNSSMTCWRRSPPTWTVFSRSTPFQFTAT